MTMEKFKSGWMFKYLRFIFKTLIVALFLCYILIGLNAAIVVAQKTIARSQDINVLTALIDKSIRTDDLHAVTRWVAFRLNADTDALIPLITPRSGELEPSLFLEISQRELQLDRPEDALFWAQLGRYRLRYDALRCGAGGAYKRLDGLVNLLTPPAIKNLLRKHPELEKKSIRQVMDFDQKYPARNSPAYICAALNKANQSPGAPMAKEDWKIVRDLLRKGAEDYLKSPNKKE